MEVATDMSETERMKAERAARVALEEERIKAEKEAVSGGGNPLINYNLYAVPTDIVSHYLAKHRLSKANFYLQKIFDCIEDY